MMSPNDVFITIPVFPLMGTKDYYLDLDDERHQVLQNYSTEFLHLDDVKKDPQKNLTSIKY